MAPKRSTKRLRSRSVEAEEPALLAPAKKKQSRAKKASDREQINDEDDDFDHEDGQQVKPLASNKKPKKESESDKLFARFDKAGANLADEKGETPNKWPVGGHMQPHVLEQSTKWNPVRVDILAHHLACEDAFITIMRNHPREQDISLVASWAGSIYLPFRFSRYPDGAGFKLWLKNNRDYVRTRAMEIHDSVTSAIQTVVEGSTMPPPDTSGPSYALRDQLVNVHFTRQAITRAMKNATSLQALLARILHAKLHVESGGVVETLIARVQHLDKFVEACRSKLQESSIVEAGVSLLDTLLESTPPDSKNGKIYELLTTASAPYSRVLIGDEELVSHDTEHDDNHDDMDVDQDKVTHESVQAIRNAIRQAHPFEVAYLDGRKFGDGTDKVATRVTRPLKAVDNKKTTGTDSSTGQVLSSSELDLAETNCSKWLADLGKDIDGKRFTMNFRHFEGIQSREPWVITELKKNHDSNQRDFVRRTKMPRAWIKMTSDNVYHIRQFMRQVHENDLLSPTQFSSSDLNGALRRMLALLALMYGCFPEASLWLTVMDQLLENLAGFFRGNTSAPFTTVSMTRVATALKQGTSPMTVQVPATAEVVGRLEREFKSRRVFAELASFFRGAILLSYGGASQTKSMILLKDRAIWYDGVLKLSTKCGHAWCADQVRAISSDGVRKFSISITTRGS